MAPLHFFSKIYPKKAKAFTVCEFKIFLAFILTFLHLNTMVNDKPELEVTSKWRQKWRCGHFSNIWPKGKSLHLLPHLFLMYNIATTIAAAAAASSSSSENTVTCVFLTNTNTNYMSEFLNFLCK